MSKNIKPNILVDVKKSISPFSKIEKRVNLGGPKIIILPLLKIFKAAAVFLVITPFIFGFVSAPPMDQTSLAAQSNEERAALEAQLAELESQIANYESTIESYRKQGDSLKSEIRTLEAKVSKINLQIKATNLSLSRLDKEISETKDKISATEEDIEINKNNLSELLQDIYENDKRGLIEILFKNPQFSDFFNDVNNIMLVQDNLRIAFQQMQDLHGQLLDQKEQLAIERTDVSALKSYQDVQAKSVESIKSEKDQLLKTTKGNESKYQELLEETQKTAAQIRSRIFELLGGGELTFEKAYELAKIAENATGVRAALILAVLDRESALGKNVGRCNYKTAMHPTRDMPAFLQIMSELGMDPDSVQVSCPIYSDGAYGGAMGPAQFIPSTWMLFKDDIAKATGNNPPSPWRNIDAFTATALYLKDAGAANASISNERIAAAKYYAGGRWRTFLWTYGDRVITRAQSFQKDIDILNS